MLRRSVTYKDFNDEEVTDTLYFNLSKSELVDLEVKYEGGFKRMIEKIIESRSRKEIVELLKDIIKMSYGEKTPDGKSFYKKQGDVVLSDAFIQTAAYDQLFFEMIEDSDVGAAFIIGILPPEYQGEAAKAGQAAAAELAAKGSVTPPSPPTPPTA
jgi:hypothetical protein